MDSMVVTHARSALGLVHGPSGALLPRNAPVLLPKAGFCRPQASLHRRPIQGGERERERERDNNPTNNQQKTPPPPPQSVRHDDVLVRSPVARSAKQQTRKSASNLDVSKRLRTMPPPRTGPPPRLARPGAGATTRGCAHHGNGHFPF